jgi:uncharacterized protein (UPF0332 family)
VIARLGKTEPRIEREFTRFLARGYTLKEVADYALSPRIVVTADDAREMIETARRFIDRLAEIIG